MPDLYLVYGRTGWIGSSVYRLLEGQGKTVVGARARVEDLRQIEEELDAVRPSHVMMAAGLTGRPNVDWCETNRAATVMANVAGLLNVVHACKRRDIHCTVFGTGCVYDYDSSHSAESGKGFTEAESGNYGGSYYSRCKKAAQELVAETYDNVLLLRVRMPISDDTYERSFVMKLIRYPSIVDAPNSVSVLREVLPIAVGLAGRGTTGVYNLTNPGTVSHNEVLGLYRDHVDPGFTWANTTAEELQKRIVAGRCNNHLDTRKLEAAAAELGLPLHCAREAVKMSMVNLRLTLPLDWPECVK